MIVADRMTKSPITVSPRDTAERAIALMDGAHVDHLPVCEGKRLVGLLARAELLARIGKLIGRHASREQIDRFTPLVQVAGVMTLDPPRVLPEAPIADAMTVMRSRGLTALAVVDDHQIVGILTTRDLWSSLGDRERWVAARGVVDERNGRHGDPTNPRSN